MVIGEVMTFLAAVLSLGSADTPGLVEEEGSLKLLLPFTSIKLLLVCCCALMSFLFIAKSFKVTFKCYQLFNESVLIKTYLGNAIFSH